MVTCDQTSPAAVNTKVCAFAVFVVMAIVEVVPEIVGVPIVVVFLAEADFALAVFLEVPDLVVSLLAAEFFLLEATLEVVVTTSDDAEVALFLALLANVETNAQINPITATIAITTIIFWN